MVTPYAVPEALNAWAICLRASEEARRRGDRRVGTDHILLAILEEPLTEAVLGVSLVQARQALDSLDHTALAALGLRGGEGAPELAMRAVPTKPRLRDVARRDRLRITPSAKKILERASKPNRQRLYVTGPQVLAQILRLPAPDPAAALLRALNVDVGEVERRLSEVPPTP